MSRRNLILVCLLIGFTLAAIPRLRATGYGDSPVYAQTARFMKQGQGYYRADVESLYAPPSQARSVRLPTSSLMLRWVPEKLWFPLDGLFWACALFIVALLGGVWVLLLAALWLLLGTHFSTALYAEVYGLPFALWGFHEIKEGHDANAALSFGVACAFRELYVVGLVVGFLLRRRWPWLVMGLAVLAGYAAHYLAVKPYLVSGGRESRLGALGYHWQNISRAVAPWNNWYSVALAVCIGALALVAFWRNRDAFTALYVLLLCAASLWSLRYYWQVTWVLPMIAGLHPHGHTLAAKVLGVRAPHRADRDVDLNGVAADGTAVENALRHA